MVIAAKEKDVASRVTEDLRLQCPNGYAIVYRN